MTVDIQRSFQSQSGDRQTGTLYLVATPIGNLEDMTYRAVRTLREADIIAAEDTRQTRKLLAHFQISAKLFSYHEHNKHASGPEIIRYIIEGKNIALVSDAGLPAISDPGADLVQLALAERIPVVPVPGANAALSALIASGLATDRFTFIGFLPRDNKGIENALRSLRSAEGTLIFYESPHRTAKTLKHMLDILGNRRIVLARELTKKFEEWARGTIEQCLAWLEEHPPQGEYCLVVEAGTSEEEERDAIWWQALSIEEHVGHYEARNGGNRKEAMKQAASDRNVSKRDVYNALLRQE
ncbi:MULTISPECIES: 16S rRNA (cytidine(1402)-2'-O)-methyltransferase [unclassified Paenibacillus]|uniref:16S rRNA (cytidine(1402)-2'-O)-methyltransferase n=1 Tax=unclassified Paenibacillus TaxID=185978 RepID=UPI001C104D3F|nr:MULTISPECIES: 16S rRNA (cytidine(1402)-2'-O)-methyltransferase [unclassified Paenibacillus]MBU5444152.1 16S rRNA (cytidine(1402)-2'-O)-methyltransferase [Paenibacillus sp. MSJ-34]CAH0121974.1 Ribosomal RNA small subunit methyltransferase I [Paenibacillus sp. CECT 9249]